MHICTHRHTHTTQRHTHAHILVAACLSLYLQHHSGQIGVKKKKIGVKVEKHLDNLVANKTLCNNLVLKDNENISKHLII